MASSSCLIGFSVVFWIVAIVGVALFGSSFGTVDLNTAALYQNRYTVQIDSSKVYLNGRYFTGLGGLFIYYPTTWQYIHFSNDVGSNSPVLNPKSADGTTITLEVTIVFRLKYEFIAQLYSNYKTNYMNTMVNTARDAIQKVVTTYTAQDFFNKRRQIENEMSQKLSSKYKESFQSELILLLLREVSLSAQFESTIITSQVKRQEVKTADQQNIIQNITAQMSVIQSEANLTVNNNIAEANALSQEIVAKKTAEGEILIRQAEGKAIQNFMLSPDQNDTNGEPGLGFTEEQVMRFLYLEKLINLENIELLLDLPSSTFINI